MSAPDVGSALKLWIGTHYGDEAMFANRCQRWGTKPENVRAFVSGKRDLPGKVVRHIASDTGIPMERLMMESARTLMLARDPGLLKIAKKRHIFYAGGQVVCASVLREGGHDVFIPPKKLPSGARWRREFLKALARKILTSTDVVIMPTEDDLPAWVAGFALAWSIPVYAHGPNGGMANPFQYPWLELTTNTTFTKLCKLLKGDAV